MLSHFFKSDFPTQIIVVLAVAVIVWHVVFYYRPRSPTLQLLKVERVSFLLVFWLIGTVGSSIYALIVPVWPAMIVALGSLSWDLAALAILKVRPGSRF